SAAMMPSAMRIQRPLLSAPPRASSARIAKRPTLSIQSALARPTGQVSFPANQVTLKKRVKPASVSSPMCAAARTIKAIDKDQLANIADLPLNLSRLPKLIICLRGDGGKCWLHHDPVSEWAAVGPQGQA